MPYPCRMCEQKEALGTRFIFSPENQDKRKKMNLCLDCVLKEKATLRKEMEKLFNPEQKKLIHAYFALEEMLSDI